MSIYPSLYRAKATRWTGTALQVLIPQVFGEATVYVTDYLNAPTTGMGWVMFQGGDPEHPVWLGPLTTAAVEGGSGPDWSDEISALQAADVVLQATDVAYDARLDALEAGTGTDEVWIGPGTPPAGQELWYDTDEVPAMTGLDQRWNTAWGIVGQATAPGTDQTGIGSTGTAVTGCAVTFVAVAGRTYKTTMTLNFGQNTSAGIVTPTIGGKGRSCSLQASEYMGYSDVLIEPNLSGSVTRQAMISTNAGTVSIINSFSRNATLVVEDIGPASMSVSMPNPIPSWLPLPLLNGWTSYDAPRTVQYRLIGDMVQVRGLARAGSAIAIGQLPIGYRTPLSYQAWMAEGNTTAPVAVETLSNGTIQVGAAFAIPTYVYLDPIQFSVTP